MADDETHEGPRRGVDALIDALAEGQQGEASGFSLDRDKAREKLAQFALPSPYHYVLQLVQAAVLKGARRVRFDIDADDMHCRFDGRAFTSEDFEHLYSAFFTSADDDDVQARRELALGLNAALARAPKFIEVLSSDGERGAALRLVPGDPDAYHDIDPREEPGTEIHVKLPAGVGIVGRKVKDLAGKLPEEQVLRQHCRFARVEIVLEGKRLDGRDAWIEEGLGQAPVEADGVEGNVVFHPGVGEAGELHVVRNEVLIATLEVGGTFPGLMAVVRAPGMRRDVSQFDIVKDDEMRRVRQCVHRAGEVALADLALRYANFSPRERERQAWALGTLRVCIREHWDLDIRQYWALRKRRQPPKLQWRLAKAPIYPYATADEPEAGYRALETLLQTAKRTTVAYVTSIKDVERVAELGRYWQSLLVLEDPDDVAFLSVVLEKSFRDVTPESKKEAAARRGRPRFTGVMWLVGALAIALGIGLSLVAVRCSAGLMGIGAKRTRWTKLCERARSYDLAGRKVRAEKYYRDAAKLTLRKCPRPPFRQAIQLKGRVTRSNGGWSEPGAECLVVIMPLAALEKNCKVMVVCQTRKAIGGGQPPHDLIFDGRKQGYATCFHIGGGLRVSDTQPRQSDGDPRLSIYLPNKIAVVTDGPRTIEMRLTPRAEKPLRKGKR